MSLVVTAPDRSFRSGAVDAATLRSLGERAKAGRPGPPYDIIRSTEVQRMVIARDVLR
jgi:hypothetical protein